MSTRRRHPVITFRFRIAPVGVKCCGCGCDISGKRAWDWLEDGERKRGCVACVFPRALLGKPAARGAA